MVVQLVNNKGYEWSNENGNFFKGYICLNGKYYYGKQALALFEAVNDIDGLCSVLDKAFGGIYAVVIKTKEGRYLLGTDIMRSFPLFVSKDMIISDNLVLIKDYLKLGMKDVDTTVVEELYNNCFIGHSRTIFKNVVQVDAGEVISIQKNNNILRRYYYVHKRPTANMGRNEALEKFKAVSKTVFAEIVNEFRDKPLVLSLSGGYDSRYVACMLKHAGAIDVSCYSYGKRGSFEVEQSKKVAEALGFRWKCVEYNNSRIEQCYNKGFLDFFHMADSLDSTIYLQNYLAVKTLHDEQWIKKGSIFITGLCNDMPSGAYVKSKDHSFCATKDYLLKELTGEFFKKHQLNSKAAVQFRKELIRVIKEMGLSVHNYQEYVSSHDAVTTIGIHSRLYMHMNDAYAYYGYQWLMPCWDRRLLEFWYSLPYEYRIEQNLYEEFIMRDIPAQYGCGEKKQKISYYYLKGADLFLARIKVAVNRILLKPFGKSITREEDYNNFDRLYALYYQKLTQKKLVGIRETSLNRIMVLYLLEHYFGKDFTGSYLNKYKW